MVIGILVEREPHDALSNVEHNHRCQDHADGIHEIGNSVLIRGENIRVQGHEEKRYEFSAHIPHGEYRRIFRKIPDAL